MARQLLGAALIVAVVAATVAVYGLTSVETSVWYYPPPHYVVGHTAAGKRVWLTP